MGFKKKSVFFHNLIYVCSKYVYKFSIINSKVVWTDQTVEGLFKFCKISAKLEKKIVHRVNFLKMASRKKSLKKKPASFLLDFGNDKIQGEKVCGTHFKLCMCHKKITLMPSFCEKKNRDWLIFALKRNYHEFFKKKIYILQHSTSLFITQHVK